VNIQTRKLNFIQEFLKIQSEELISRLEKILINNEDNFNPFRLKNQMLELINHYKILKMI
jgi:hypothetical protein